MPDVDMGHCAGDEERGDDGGQEDEDDESKHFVVEGEIHVHGVFPFERVLMNMPGETKSRAYAACENSLHRQ
jgi:hypothetical protein